MLELANDFPGNTTATRISNQRKPTTFVIY
nr:MAG TPA: hypothetical protein [Caudoviricetes sp.]DAZ29238.1 MAG TPA: hypothetical protein [Caudoviricetes sp.]